MALNNRDERGTGVVNSPKKKKPAAYVLPAESTFVDWPRLSLSGVMIMGDKKSAIINKNILEIGETVEGAKLLSVNEWGVVLKYNSETQFLYKGRSTWE